MIDGAGAVAPGTVAPGTVAPGTVVGLGMDLVDVARFRRVLERRGESFRERIFSPGERAYAERANDPTERFAARFAAKEAVLKALGLGLGSMKLRDIEVVKAKSGAPSLVLHDTAAAVASEHGVGSWHITLSHTHVTASAVVIALR